MKKLSNKLIKGQRGQILPTVLVVLLAGVLILVPTLAVSSTSIKSVKFFRDESFQLYAADAGIEKGIAILKTTYPDKPSIPEGGYPSFMINGNTTQINRIEEVYNTDPPTFEIESTATDSGGSTRIIARVQAYSSLLSSALVGLEYVDIGPNTKVEGDVVSEADCVDDKDPIFNQGEVTGNVTCGVPIPWPEGDVLKQYYWNDDLDPLDGPKWEMNSANVSIGSGYRNGNLRIYSKVTGANLTIEETGLFNGIGIYLKGNNILDIGKTNQDFTLNLNKNVIFSEGTIDIGGKCTLTGSGCIIALGDIIFMPNVQQVDPGSYILLMSVDGTVKFQPTGDFYGTVAGNVEAILQPNYDLIWNDPSEVDWGEGGSLPYPWWLSRIKYRLWIVKQQ